MKDNGVTIFHGVKESSYIMKMSFIRAHLFVTVDKALENTSILEYYTRENGAEISARVMEFKVGEKVSITKDNGLLDAKMAKDSYSLRTAVTIKDNFVVINYTVVEFIAG